MGAGVNGVERCFERRIIGRPENASCRLYRYRSRIWRWGAGNYRGAAYAAWLSRNGLTWRTACQAKPYREDDADAYKRWQTSPGRSIEGTFKRRDLFHLTKPMRKKAGQNGQLFLKS